MTYPDRRDIVVRRPARLSVAVPLGYLRRLPLKEVADEVAEAGGEETTASHGVVVVGVGVLLLKGFLLGDAGNVNAGAADNSLVTLQCG